jgi:hypothetical protein
MNVQKINKSIRGIIVIFLITIISNGIASAKCVRVADVKYQQQYGWSKMYRVEVSFMSGMELNSATSTYNYSSYSNYAIIFWAEGQATVIKLSSIIMCGYTVTCSCIDNLIMDLQGYDQDGDKWNICLGQFCY